MSAWDTESQIVCNVLNNLRHVPVLFGNIPIKVAKLEMYNLNKIEIANLEVLIMFTIWL